jgi:LPXTG-site transpeptidase (sortase) family protein
VCDFQPPKRSKTRTVTLRAKYFAQTAQGIFAVLGILALGYCATVWVRAKLFQVREEREFAHKLQTAPVVGAAAHAKANAVEGSVVGILAIPRLGLSTVVIEGVSDADLAVASGHIPGTSLPGESGNVAVAGHRDTSFRALRFIRKDDSITLITMRGEYSYRVVSTEVVQPNDVQVLYPTRDDILTLVTCYPFRFFGHAPQRFIVRAERNSGPHA